MAFICPHPDGPRGPTAVGMTPTSQKRRKTMGAVGSDAWQKLQARYDSG